MKRTTHALVGATTLGILVPALVTGLASTATATRTTYAQNTGIAINDPDSTFLQSSAGITVTDNAAATPSPSEIVSTVPGTVGDVDVYLNGIDHNAAEDIDILLVGPGGRQATIMSDVGGANALVSTYFGLSDEAVTPLTTDPITDNWYRPTNLEGADAFGASAPAANGASSLSAFDGAPAAGTWSLYVIDDTGQAVSADGTIGSWSLDITTAATTDPYPSTVTVANALPVITDVDVTLTGLTHTYVGDVDMLLVGPGGQQATLVSDAANGFDTTNLTFTLDDEASANLPDADFTAGTYRPVNYDTDIELDQFPAPAPTASGATKLSAFDGTNPNGTWKLYVTDDAGGDTGSLAGWSLSIDAIDPTAPTGSVAINNGAASTGSTAVTLNLSADDPAPASGVTQMRFSNDGTNWSAWQPYAATAAWQLPTGNGVKTVWAQFTDAGGNVSAAASDTVVLAVTLPDTTAPSASKSTPADGATGVKPGVQVKVKVSEKLLASSVTKQSVVLKKKGSSKAVKAKVGYKPAKNLIVVDPKRDLDEKAKYVLVVKTTVKDLAGNAFDAKPKAGVQPLKLKFATK